MKVSDAVAEFLKQEVIPHIAGESSFTAALLNGALNAGKKKFFANSGTPEIFTALGIADQNGNIDAGVIKDFVDGAFGSGSKVDVSLAELLKLATGVESASPLLQGRLTFTRSDADKFLELLRR